MITILITEGLDGFTRLDLGKGCVAVFRTAEYYAAIARGKSEARALHQARRESHAQAVREAATLAWIDKDVLP